MRYPFKPFAYLFLLPFSFSLSNAVEITTNKAGELSNGTTYSGGIAPTAADILAIANNGDYTLNQDMTVQRLFTNWSSRAQSITMVDSEGYEVVDPAEFPTLTVDINTDTTSAYRTIELRSNSGTNVETNHLYFKNGNIVFKNSLGTNTLELSTSPNTIRSDTGAISSIIKIVEFGENSVVRSYNQLTMTGTNSTLANQSNFIVNGSLTVADDTDAYKQLSINATQFNVGSQAVVNVGTLELKAKSVANIAGTLNTNGNSVLFDTGASLNITGTLSAKNAYPKSTTSDVATLTVKSGATLNVSHFLNPQSNGALNIEQGGVANVGYLHLSAGSKTTIAGSVVQNSATATGQTTTANVSIANGAEVIITETGSLSLAGGWTNLQVLGTLDISGAVNSVYIPSCIRIENTGKLILRSSNAYTQGSGQGNSVVWFYTGNGRMEILANNDFKSLAFTTLATPTIYIGDDVDLITLTYITSYLDSSSCVEGIAQLANGVILENFRLDTIKITNVNEHDKDADGWLAFVSEGWENFYIDSNGFLAATAVPEPAQLAAIFGAIALGLAYLRRKKL